MQQVRTLGALRRAGYRPLSVREEIRRNLLKKLRNHEKIFPGIIGYEDTVIPQVINALIAGHNMIFLGERGQAKSRMLRALVGLLDEYIPAVKGCEIRDNPFDPICRRCRELVSSVGDDLEIVWVHRSERYVEKLATPDVSIGDIIGEVDPVKVAEGRYLSDERTVHFGLIPRSNRGIFAVNELPDLPERIQVGLFNIMEEGDIQIRSYSIRLPLDILIVATANPEDYTNRGRIVTPLKDRFDAQIRTHYPESRQIEIAIMEQEAKIPRSEGLEVYVPSFIKEIIAEITFAARKSSYINQRSGVSVRMSIANLEAVVAGAVRRSILLGEKTAVPRITDLRSLRATSEGKLELEYTVEDKEPSELLEEFTLQSVRKVFDERFSTQAFQGIITLLEEGAWIEVGDDMPSAEYFDLLDAVPGLREKIEPHVNLHIAGEVASCIEFVLEGLHAHNLIKRVPSGGRVKYRGLYR